VGVRRVPGGRGRGEDSPCLWPRRLCCVHRPTPRRIGVAHGVLIGHRRLRVPEFREKTRDPHKTDMYRLADGSIKPSASSYYILSGWLVPRPYTIADFLSLHITGYQARRCSSCTKTAGQARWCSSCSDYWSGQ
jgi:hypothetical protein